MKEFAEFQEYLADKYKVERRLSITSNPANPNALDIPDEIAEISHANAVAQAPRCRYYRKVHTKSLKELPS